MKGAVRHNGLDGTKHPNPMARLGSPYKQAMCDYLFVLGVERYPEYKVTQIKRSRKLALERKEVKFHFNC